MDVLTDVLTVTRTRGTALDQLVAAAPWGVRLPESPIAAFHAVAQGTCWLTVPGHTPVQLVAGDIALLPAGAGHLLTSAPDTIARPYAELAAAAPTARTPTGGRLELPGSGPVTHLMCGGYRYHHDGPHPALSLLPAVVHLPAHAASDTAVPTLLRLLASELTDPQPGAATVVDRLVDAMFVHILRIWAAHTHGQPHWLRALRDATVASAISAIHTEPARPWRVADLARVTGLSRAAFARRFTGLVGEPPLTYLTRWRMDLAAHRLRSTNQPVTTVARAVGYRSEYAFSRAFHRSHGMPPTRYRDAAQARDPATKMPP